MGSRISINLRSVLGTPTAVVEIAQRRLIETDPYHKDDNPMVDVARVDFYHVAPSVMERELFHTHYFDVVGLNSHEITLEADYNILRGSEATVKLQRALMVCSIVHTVIPG